MQNPKTDLIYLVDLLIDDISDELAGNLSLFSWRTGPKSGRAQGRQIYIWNCSPNKIFKRYSERRQQQKNIFNNDAPILPINPFSGASAVGMASSCVENMWGQ